MTIRRFGPLSCAKIAGVIYGAVGFLIGVFVSLFAVLGLVFSSTQRDMPGHPAFPVSAAVMGLGAIVAFPIFYGVLGFVLALIGAWLYNLIASKVGGVEIDIT